AVGVSRRAGTRPTDLRPPPTEWLCLRAVHRAGGSAAGLAGALFGDAGCTVTVRAEMSRVRRYLGGLLEHRPYRFGEDVEVEVLLPDDPHGLFPATGAHDAVGPEPVGHRPAPAADP